MSKLWKDAERRIAKLLGGQRVPVTGRQRGSAPDIQHDLFSVEVKHRKEIPDWILDALDQAEKSRVAGQIPVVILHKQGQKYEDCLTVFRLSDIVDLYQKVVMLEEKLSDTSEMLRRSQ